MSVCGGCDEVERVDDRAAIAVGHRLPQLGPQLVVEGTLGVVAPAQPRRDTAQRREVAHAEAPPRTREQPHQFGTRLRFMHYPQRADEIGDLWFGHEPTDSEHVIGHALGA